MKSATVGQPLAENLPLLVTAGRAIGRAARLRSPWMALLVSAIDEDLCCPAPGAAPGGSRSASISASASCDQQVRAVPAADQLQPVAVQQAFAAHRIAREFAAQLDAGEADVLDVAKHAFERRVAAQLGHVVVDPGDRADAEADGHRRTFPICSS